MPKLKNLKRLFGWFSNIVQNVSFDYRYPPLEHPLEPHVKQLHRHHPPLAGVFWMPQTHFRLHWCNPLPGSKIQIHLFLAWKLKQIRHTRSVLNTFLTISGVISWMVPLMASLNSSRVRTWSCANLSKIKIVNIIKSGVDEVTTSNKLRIKSV